MRRRVARKRAARSVCTLHSLAGLTADAPFQAGISSETDHFRSICTTTWELSNFSQRKQTRWWSNM